ncbi:MAG: hypothetical protein IT443_08570 [Phycisphaeraceae bacterium]|nr:hypothetical protein [Phycisphaeraceae bacterium]
MSQNALGRVVCAVTLAFLLLAMPVQAALITIYGGPTYTPGVEGYRGGWVSFITASTAVGTTRKYNAAGTILGNRAVRWHSVGSVTELGLLGTDLNGYTNTSASAINADGTAVGEAYKYDGLGADLGRRAVRWDASGTAATELDNLGTSLTGVTNSSAAAINAAGTTAGTADKYDGLNGYKGPRAVRWDAGGTAVTELDSLGTDANGYTISTTSAINAGGTIVGRAQKYNEAGLDRGSRPVRWDALSTLATELDVLGTATNGYTDGNALALNTSGTAVGWVYKYSGGINKGSRAVRWNAAGTVATELGVLGTDAGTSTWSSALAINDAGTAVGWANKYDALGHSLGSRAVRWDAAGTTATELGNLGLDVDGATSGQASALNSLGLAVGWSEKYDILGNDLGQVATVWGLNGLALDLNTLIDPSSGWMLTEAHAVSDSGWITGLGQYDPDGAGGQSAYGRLWLLHYYQPVKGDFNGDGVVTLSDINPFKLALTDIDAWQAQFPDVVLADVDPNSDGVITLSDINPFKDLLTGGSGQGGSLAVIGGASTMVPEPATAAWLILSLAIFGRRSR